MPYTENDILGSPFLWGTLDCGPTFGLVRRPLFQTRIITAAGTVSIEPFDFQLIFRKTVPAAFAVLLPSVRTWMNQPYGGIPIILKDGLGDASTNNITITPNGADTIDGLASYLMAGDNASITLRPLGDYTGWIAT